MKRIKGIFYNYSAALKSLRLSLVFSTLMFGFVFAMSVFAQTMSFTYQGKLNDGETPANASYDMQFKLFSAETAGSQIGTTQTKTNVPTEAGIFTVQLDFPNAFPGADRWLEISISPAGQNNYTTLMPRQKITSAPYAVRASNANLATNSAQLGGVAANQFVQTSDARLSDARNPLPGSGNYVQNTDAAQANANFNIGGTGKANILEAATQFNLNGNRVLSLSGAVPNSNIFLGVGAGNSEFGSSFNSFFGYRTGFANTSGNGNSFFGAVAGEKNTTGGYNSFFGRAAGFYNTTGDANSFFGNGAGQDNTTGSNNAFFGYHAGFRNTTGNANSFFGLRTGEANTIGTGNSAFGNAAGLHTTTGNDNAFLGRLAGWQNTSGGYNVFVGLTAGESNLTGNYLTMVGANANVGASNLSYATAIGAGAVVNSSNTVVLGRSADTVQIPGLLNVNGAFGSNILNAATQFNLNGNRILSNGGTSNLFAGVGAGANNTSGGGNSFFGDGAGAGNTTSHNNSFFGSNAGLVATGANNSFFGNSAGYQNTTGESNTYLGSFAGFLNTTGNDNIFIGKNASNLNLSTQVNNSMAIGNFVKVSTSNTIVLGDNTQTTRIPGVVRLQTGTASNTFGVAATFSGAVSGFIAQNLVFRDLNSILSSPSHLCFRSISVGGGDGGWGVTNCTTSFASADYKSEMKPFTNGLDIIKRLKPVAFKWKADGIEDVGLVAEEVAEVAPQLITRDDKGKIEDVKENSLNVVFINAIKEQQKQIETQAAQIKQQQQQIDRLKKLVCQSNPQGDLCKDTAEQK